MTLLEVETKVRVKNPNALRKKILRIAKFKKKESRGDDYFAIRLKGYPKKAFRIRATPGHYVVNFKKWLTSYWTRDIVVKEEYEFELQNENALDTFLALMRDLGFRQWLKKRKTTEKYVHKKDKRIIIEISRVAHLGYFMEIEYVAKKSEMEKAIKKIRNTLKELEIDSKDVTNKGYTRMLWDKGIKDKKYWLD